MKGIDILKELPLETQKEFAREFVRQKSRRKLVKYLDRHFELKSDFIWCAFMWVPAKKKYMWANTYSWFLANEKY